MRLGELAATVGADGPQRRLSYRPIGALPYLTDTASVQGALLLDSGVYIHALKGKLPAELEGLLTTSRDVFHASVAIAELVVNYTALDSADPRTKAARAEIGAMLDDIPADRIVTPDHEDWQLAAALAGRVGQQRPGGYKDVINDALLLALAQRLDMTLITAACKDFDLLTQLRAGNVVMYRAT